MMVYCFWRWNGLKNVKAHQLNRTLQDLAMLPQKDAEWRVTPRHKDLSVPRRL